MAWEKLETRLAGSPILEVGIKVGGSGRCLSFYNSPFEPGTQLAVFIDEEAELIGFSPSGEGATLRKKVDQRALELSATGAIKKLGLVGGGILATG